MKVNNNAPKGEASHKAKLTEKQVLEIKRLLAKGGHCADIGQNFNVARSTIENIKRGTTWRHLK